MHKTFLFLLIALIIIIPNSYATNLTLNVIQPGEVGADENDEIKLDNDETLDVTNNIETIAEETETIGGVKVELTQQVEFVAHSSDSIVLKNTDLPTVTAEIPDLSIVKAPSSWNKQITPPKTVTTSGSVSSNFQTPTSSILIGSPDVILVFDQVVIILLEGTTGQIAYKTPGSNNWILISGCTGTYEKPDNPPDNGECSISNGSDTKILTFHFTEFTSLSATPASTPTSTQSSSSANSGGHGNTAVGSPRIFGSSSGSSGGGYYPPTQTGPISFPSWFDNVSDWYREGKISAKEFLWAYQWIVENVL